SIKQERSFILGLTPQATAMPPAPRAYRIASHCNDRVRSLIMPRMIGRQARLESRAAESLMPRDLVEQPLRGPRAFEHTGDAAVMSQAAILLLLGTLHRGDDRALRSRAATVGALRAGARSPATGGVSFPVPRIPRTGDRIPDEVATAGLARRLRPAARTVLAVGAVPGSALRPPP